MPNRIGWLHRGHDCIRKQYACTWVMMPAGYRTPACRQGRAVLQQIVAEASCVQHIHWGSAKARAPQKHVQARAQAGHAVSSH